MDSLARLTRFAALLAFIALVCWTPRAFASGTVTGTAPTSCYGYYVSPYEQSGLSFFSCTPEGAIQKFADYWEVNHAVCSPGFTYYSIIAGTITSSAFYYTGGACSSAAPTRGGTNGNYRSFTRTTATPLTGGCPSNSTASGATCTCNANFVPNATSTACTDSAARCAEVIATLNANGQSFSLPSGVANTSFCGNYVGLKGTSAFAGSGGAVVNGPYSCRGNGECTPVSGSPAAAASAPSTSACGFGLALQIVNGVSTCAAPSTSAQSQPVSASAPSGAASAPITTIGDGSGGTIAVPPGGSATRDVSCVGKACTTSITVRDGAGNIVGTSTGTGTKEGFCSDNPEVSICKDSSFSGVCAAGFTCTGDAVSCAMAKEQHARNCTLFEATGALRDTGQSALDRGDTLASDHPRNAANITTTSLSGGFDQTELLSGSCPGDQSIDIGGGRSVSIPWSKLCASAALLGNLMIGITALACLGIAFKQG